MHAHAVQTARALYRDGTLSLSQAATYLGWTPAHVRARFGPGPETEAGEPAGDDATVTRTLNPGD